jgi:predicted nucleotidyltransferase component of viral defense system
MDRVIRLNGRQRSELFTAASGATGMVPIILEKDFWVCWTLRELFGLPRIGEHLIFKGGTSLSKAYRVIQRFSEDIDVSIDRDFLGFAGADAPEAATSNKERQRRVDALMAASQQKIRQELQPALTDAIGQRLGSVKNWSVEFDESDPDGQTLLFHYPSSLPSHASGYIRRSVKIEMGARADHWPSESKPITPYVAEQFPEGFQEPACLVKVLSAERTFWEKATILHAEYHRPAEKASPDRLSRHYYDFDALIQSGIDKTASLNLLSRVSEHKGVFFRSGWAKYSDASPGTLRIAPPDTRRKALHDDYAKMREMFFGDVPDFEGILDRLSAWEKAFNSA